jgi:hypothetical protein
VRGGVSYDTRAAKDGWLRSSFDGAARVFTAAGVAYRTPKHEINLGAGFVYEGENTNGGAAAGGRDCNPTSSNIDDCGDGSQRPLDERRGPDPTSPLLTPELQFEAPFNQGTIKSHYILFMLGYSHFF